MLNFGVILGEELRGASGLLKQGDVLVVGEAQLPHLLYSREQSLPGAEFLPHVFLSEGGPDCGLVRCRVHVSGLARPIEDMLPKSGEEGVHAFVAKVQLTARDAPHGAGKHPAHGGDDAFPQRRVGLGELPGPFLFGPLADVFLNDGFPVGGVEAGIEAVAFGDVPDALVAHAAKLCPELVGKLFPFLRSEQGMHTVVPDLLVHPDFGHAVEAVDVGRDEPYLARTRIVAAFEDGFPALILLPDMLRQVFKTLHHLRLRSVFRGIVEGGDGTFHGL